ncbi:MAG: hypothetical protein L6Q59_04340 [Ignavibacteriaceae bacterium]|nr:hypothetical protein [Ignavibacteriaceae bacterium]
MKKYSLDCSSLEKKLCAEKMPFRFGGKSSFRKIVLSDSAASQTDAAADIIKELNRTQL